MWSFEGGKSKMWPFAKKPDPLEFLTFVDEVRFRDLVDEYYRLAERIRRAAPDNLTYYRYSDELSELVADHAVARDQLAAELRDAGSILQGWVHLQFQRPHKFEGLHLLSEHAQHVVSTNLSILRRIVDTADDPKLEGRRKRREREQSGVDSKRVFVVHGRDLQSLQWVQAFLSSVGMQPVVLHEQANQGGTIIEKFETHADVGFAVVLLTPDDEVRGGDNGAAKWRARQNVILELGYFVAKLGRSRVCTLKKGDIEVPSDFFGVAYADFDSGGGWKIELLRELLAAGYDVDMNKLAKEK